MATQVDRKKWCYNLVTQFNNTHNVRACKHEIVILGHRHTANQLRYGCERCGRVRRLHAAQRIISQDETAPANQHYFAVLQTNCTLTHTLTRTCIHLYRYMHAHICEHTSPGSKVYVLLKISTIYDMMYATSNPYGLCLCYVRIHAIHILHTSIYYLKKYLFLFY